MKAPGTWTVDGLFAGRPEAEALFGMVKDFVVSLGPTKVEASKTQVSFGTRRKFAWVWLPQMWIKKQPEASIVVAFDLPHRVEHPRVKESVEPYPGRWMHHVVIEKPADFTDDVRGWLREAYLFSQVQRKPAG